jgi:pSer/pThr/pTyr-binding forkhead associated (FHA) protein
MSDALVSGTHAHIKVHSDRSVSIEDCGSSNGTFVNGQRLTGEYRLEPGDVVHLGSDSTRLSLDQA